MIKKYRKIREHYHYTGKYRGAAHSICYLKYSVPTETAVVFNNGSNYDYHFIKKVLAEEFEGQFTWLVENTENYLTFSVPKKKKNSQELIKKEKTSKKLYLADYNLLIVRDLW